MKIKEKTIQRILGSNDSLELKKALKIRRSNDYFKEIINYLEKIIYNYDDKYVDVIYKLLDIIDQDIVFTEDYLDKCDKIILFRKNFSNLNRILSKKSKSDRYNYYEIKNIIDSLDKQDICFDNEVKTSKISNISFDSLLDFSWGILKNSSIENFDIVCRILNYLEKELSINTNDILKKCDSISDIKTLIQYKIDMMSDNYKKEKESINNYNYVLRKLEKLEVNLRKKIEDDLNLREEENVSFYLLENLERIVNNFSERNVDAVYKILGLLEKEIVKDNDSSYIKEVEKILELRKSVVNTIKSTKKNTRNSHRKYYYLRDIANKLENLEINIIYNIKSSEVIANYNVIKYIIFDLENIKYTENLINNNPYLINAFNLNSENIFSLLVDKYLDLVNSDERYYKKLCYYDKTLDLLLKNKFIRIDDSVKKENINKITKIYKDRLMLGKSNEFISSWYKNLIDKIKDIEYVKDEKQLNKMYNIIVPKGEELDNPLFYSEKNDKDFIVTIDNSKDVNKDDAFSVKRIDDDLYNLKVYIADPNSLFSNSSISMKDARNNAETIYLSDKEIEMFHPLVVNNYLSLDEGKKRNVKVYNYVLDKRGNFVGFDISKESIVVDKNYSYDEVNSLFNICYEEEEEKLIEDLSNIKNIINKQNSQDVFLKELGVNVTTSERIVASLMICTNSKVAEYFAKNGYPFIYRHYTDDRSCIDKSILDNVPNCERERCDHFLEEIGKTSNNAVYSLEGKNHDGLGLGYYSHVTSPNRRYADIIANRCIDNFCFSDLTDKQIKDFEKYLKDEVDYLNDRLEGIKNYYDDYAKFVLTRK